MRDASDDRKILPVRAHGLTLENRQRAIITGVEDVDSFNEQMIVLVTSAGAMTLIGDGLHISKLNLDEGQLLVEGQIIALEYDERSKPTRGRFGKLFK